MTHYRPILPVYGVELRFRRCRCGRACGGLQLDVREAVTPDGLFAGQPVVYEHLALGEAWDVADAVVDGLLP